MVLKHFGLSTLKIEDSERTFIYVDYIKAFSCLKRTNPLYSNIILGRYIFSQKKISEDGIVLNLCRSVLVSAWILMCVHCGTSRQQPP